MRVVLAAVVLFACTASLGAQQADPYNPRDRFHTRHEHPQNPKHKTELDPSRFLTTRQSAIDLPLPDEEGAFVFAIFGDRTGGPDEGIAVLKDAVRDVNLFEPDLVMTVGDLIDGYNQTPEWMDEMREYKGVMSQLICPWFPVAGNHDVYWRGPDRPENEHEGNYEMHFGPLWYAFEHKNCWFIAFYTDEGNPETGRKTFGDPENQRMSPEQFDWLASVLERARDADHVFLFAHHPRWRGGGYGDDWEKVHRLLVEAGNVSAVFAGHIHQMTYTERDGIEYVTLATVGGGQSFAVPDVGYLHHYNLVTVRKDQIAMASIPVGSVTDPRELTDELRNSAVRLSRMGAEMDGDLVLAVDGSVSSGVLRARLTNPTNYAYDAVLTPTSADSRWRFDPDHTHATVGPGETLEVEMLVRRPGNSLDDAFRPADVLVDRELLTDAFRYTVPTVTSPMPLDIRAVRPPRPSGERVLSVREGGHAVVPSDQFTLPDGPMTLECWFNADRYSNRTGLVTKTENSEHGIFVNRGVPTFSIHLNGRYVEVSAKEPLGTGQWHHVAAVYDGQEVRLYIDGRLVDSKPGSGVRTRNTLPLIVGGDVDGQGRGMSFFDGQIDAVRLSSVPRYDGESFTPQRRFEADGRTVLLLDMDGSLGQWLFDSTGGDARPRMLGRASVSEAR